MNDPKVLAIVPTYGQWDYMADTIRTLGHSGVPNLQMLVINDGHPDWNSTGAPLAYRLHYELEAAGRPGLVLAVFEDNDGCTRGWNYGLRYAQKGDFEYAIIANSDLIFPKGWWPPMLAALEKFAIVGPLTNAPGTKAEQDIRRYKRDYKLSADMADVQQTQDWLDHVYGTGSQQDSLLNGFLFAGKTATFWKHAWDEENVFNPELKMTRNEDRFIGKLRNEGGTSGLVPSSFVFHWRSVSRGLPGGPKNPTNSGFLRKEAAV